MEAGQERAVKRELSQALEPLNVRTEALKQSEFKEDLQRDIKQS